MENDLCGVVTSEFPDQSVPPCSLVSTLTGCYHVRKGSLTNGQDHVGKGKSQMYHGVATYRNYES